MNNSFDSYETKELDTSFADAKLEAEYREWAARTPIDNPDSQTRELASQLLEENTAAASEFTWDKQDELKEIRLGNVLSSTDFLYRLNRHIKARYRPANKGLAALDVWVATENGGDWCFACGVQPGQMAEYSTMYFNKHNLPTSEMYRGWRTVLVRLITGGFISEAAARKEFGLPDGPHARRYLQQLHAFRNRGN